MVADSGGGGGSSAGGPHGHNNYERYVEYERYVDDGGVGAGRRGIEAKVDGRQSTVRTTIVTSLLYAVLR